MFSQRKTTAGSIASYLQKRPNSSIPWKVRFNPVCSSTEINLSDWLVRNPIINNQARAIFAATQKNGIGQRGRLWDSPKGGVWLSAAVPCFGRQQSSGLFGLAVAYALCERLKRYDILAQIKWPNDLFFGGKKLAGFLPKLIFRGESFRLARVGIGVNVLNRTPSNGISLYQILGTKKLNLSEWSAEVLNALEIAIHLFQEDSDFYLKAEKSIIKGDIFNPEDCQIWQVDGLENNGGLRIKRGSQKKILTRWD